MTVCAHMPERLTRCACLARKTRGWPRPTEIAVGGMVWRRKGLQILVNAIPSQPRLLLGKMCQDLKGLESERRHSGESRKESWRFVSRCNFG